jgi:hypothetical protein
MFTSLLTWIKEIFLISLLSELFITLITSSQYKKYAGYISGLMIICISIKMILSLLNIDFSEKSLSYFEKNIIYSAEVYLSSGNELYIQSYIDTNVEYIEKCAADFGLTAVNVEITLDEAEIASIEVSVTGADEYEMCMEFKRFLAQNYETDSSNISVYPKN